MGFLAAWTAVKKLGSMIPWQVWTIVAIVAVNSAEDVYIHHLGYEQGKAEAIATVKEANDASKDLADQGSQDVDDCYRRGGRWDRARGVCNNRAGPGE